MSIPETNDTTEDPEVPSPDPQNGIAQALLKADPETPMKEVLEDVKRWVCTGCGREKLNKPTHCAECGATTFDRIVPNEEDDDGS
ncbi:hypothetical protein [Halorubrum sp. BV1]|uniref:hypothetical protein n=1 Tax=Halorubrum sp. BV1 TaxID=1498500 RepID=UPI000679AAEF|nr:hypothetical protein [Halorubrum sp. BV1]